MADRGRMINNLTYSDQAREIIRQLILDGTYAAGQRLKETEVSQSLGISRAPTREAIQTLAYEGLVEIVPHKGAVVATFDVGKTRGLYEVREALETMAARLAAERASASELQGLRELLKDTAERVDGNWSAPYPVDLNFHNRIFKLAENPRLQTLVSGVYAQLRLAMLRSGSAPGRATQAFKEHSAVFEALQRREPEEAECAMRLHIRNGLDNMERVFGQDDGHISPGP